MNNTSLNVVLVNPDTTLKYRRKVANIPVIIGSNKPIHFSFIFERWICKTITSPIGIITDKLDRNIEK